MIHGWIRKLTLRLTKFSLYYCLPKAIKEQAIANFIVKHHEKALNYIGLKPWKLYFDNSYNKNGPGVGMLIITRRKKLV